FLPSTNPRV
ncbi:hypothetical protein VCHENC02_5249C, partial [Vibrio harveyi]